MRRSPALRWVRNISSLNPLPTGCIFFAPLSAPSCWTTVFYSHGLYSTKCTRVGGVMDSSGFTVDGDDYLKTDSAFQSVFQGSFSIAAVITFDDGRPTSPESIMGSLDTTDGNDVVQFEIDANGLVVFDYWSNNNQAKLDTAALLSNGQETTHLFMGVADSTVGGVGGLLIYFDGAVQAAGANNGDTSGVTFADYVSTDNMFLGARNTDGTPGQFSNGVIKEFWIWDYAVGAEAALSLYNVINGRSYW